MREVYDNSTAISHVILTADKRITNIENSYIVTSGQSKALSLVELHYLNVEFRLLHG
jgi:hypothetical protein